MSGTSTENLYDLLNVSHTATTDELKQAFRTLSLQYHPDKIAQNFPSHPDILSLHQKYIKIQHAWSILSSHEQKLQYDEGLKKEMQKNLVNEQAHYTFTVDDFTATPDENDGDFITFHSTCRCTDTISFTSDEVIECLEHHDDSQSLDASLIIICPGCSLRYKVVMT